MGRLKGIAGAALALLMVVGLIPVAASAQGVYRPRRTIGSYDRAHQIGYDEGYRRGYEQGVDDARDGRTRNPMDYKEYKRGDDGYNDRVGSRDEYRIGFRAGFEQGYQDGVMGRQYGARPGQDRVVVPNGGGGPVLGRNGRHPDTYGGTGYPSGGYGYPGGQRTGFSTEMVIELETPINTRYSNEGDRFSALVVEPQSMYGARVEGYVGKLERPGRLSGKGEIVLVFQQIIYPDGYAEPMQAQVEEVIGYPRGVPRPGDRNVFKRAPWEWGKDDDDRNDDIDAKAGDEGQIEGQGSKGRDAAVIGGGAAVGAVIGSVIGGGGGAAIGAAIGAATGGGIVATTKGSHIDLEPGAQLRIRTGQGVSY